MKKLIVIPLFFVFYIAFSQNEIKVYPSSWWVGMKNPNLQIMVHGKDIGYYSKINLKISNPDVVLVSIQKVKSPNYIFLNLNISSKTKPGDLKIFIQRLGPNMFELAVNILTISLKKQTPG